MASRSECSRPMKELGLLDTSCAMDALASEIDHALISSSVSFAQLESILEVEKSGDVSVEEQIEHSKVHWSTLTDFGARKVGLLRHWKKFMLCCANVDCEEVAEVSNVEEFLALQRDPAWGGFFQTFGYCLGELYNPMGELVVGKKFADGGQAKLYDAKVKWYNPKGNDEDKQVGRKYALKIFKKGTFLKHLKSQLPQGLLQGYVEEMESFKSPTSKDLPRFQCKVLHGTLLKDGRFAFLMEKEHFDLHHLIDRNMKQKRGKDCQQFSKEEVEFIMYEVALAVEWLHNQGIVHRDLKTSNVLVWEFNTGWPNFQSGHVLLLTMNVLLELWELGFLGHQRYCKHAKIGS